MIKLIIIPLAIIGVLLHFLGSYIPALAQIPFIDKLLPFALLVVSIGWHEKRRSPLTGLSSSRRAAQVTFLVSGIVFAAGFLANNVVGSFASCIAALFLGSVKCDAISETFYGAVVKALGGKSNETFGQLMMARIDAMFSADPSPLLRGDLEAEAKRRWKFEEYPDLFINVPADLRRPVIVDGRLIDGSRVHTLLPRRLSARVVEKLYDIVLVRAGQKLLIAMAVALGIATLVGTQMWHLGTMVVSSQAGSLMTANAVTPQQIVRYQSDVWSRQDLADLQRQQDERRKNWASRADTAGKTALTISAAIAFVAAFLLTNIALVSHAFWNATRPARIRGAVARILQYDDVISTESVESVVRWKKRQEVRANERRAYLRQIQAAIADKSPKIRFGAATGTILYRGGLTGYSPGQSVELSFLDCAQSILCTGGTGSGKSFSVADKVVRGVVDAASSGSLPHDLALFVTDGKGVLWHDVKKTADEKGVEFRLIGPGEGEFGMDLFDGLEPHLIASVINEAAGQMSGRSTDPFWQDMACQIIDAAIRVCRVFEVTTEGQEYVDARGERLYSPIGVYALIRSLRDADGLAFQATAAICKGFRARDKQVLAFMTPDVWSAIEFLRKDVLNYPTQTLGSFLANVDKLLAGFTNQTSLAKAFGSGKSSKIIDVTRVWDNGVVTAVRLPTTQYGDVARLINIFIKIRVYHMAILRQQLDPRIADKSKLVILVDEAQQLVSSGGGGGTFSDSSFWNLSRATGCSGVWLVQSLAALYAAFGESANGQVTKNLLDQFRTKIFLSSESAETLAYMKELAGKAMRSTVQDFDQYESFAAQRMETGHYGADFDRIEAFEFSDESLRQIFETSDVPAEIRVEAKALVEPEWQWMNIKFTGTSILDPGKAPAVDLVQREKEIRKEAKDRRKSLMTEGKSDEHLVHDDDLSLGRGQAFIFTGARAGHSRMDFIDLNA